MFSQESNSIRAPRGFLLGPLKSTQNDEKALLIYSLIHLANAHRAPPWWVSAVNKLLFSPSEVCVLAERTINRNVVLDTNTCVVFVGRRVYLCMLPQS